MQPLCNRSPADALAATLQADNEQTKLGLSKAARKAAEEFQNDSVQVINDSRGAKQLRDIAGAASVHGWDRDRVGRECIRAKSGRDR